MQPKQDPKLVFAALLEGHCRNGLGLSTDSVKKWWSNSDLSERMSEISIAESLKRTWNEETIRLWRRGKHLPSLEAINLLLRIFFPSSSSDSADAPVADFKHAWQVAQASKSANNSENIPDIPYPGMEWEIRPGVQTPNIVELSIHAPTPTNEPGGYTNRITLVLGILEAEYDNYSILIGIQNANLLIETHGYQIAGNTMISERPGGEENFRRSVGGVEVIGPKNDKGAIKGVVISNESLCQLEALQIGNTGSLQISLLAGRNSFIVEATDANQSTVESINKRHILDAIIYKEARKDAVGRAILASAKVVKLEDTIDG